MTFFHYWNNTANFIFLVFFLIFDFSFTEKSFLTTKIQQLKQRFSSLR